MRRIGSNALQAIVTLMLLMACKGDTGPTGPQGPPGATGAQGPQGPAGASAVYNVYQGPITSTLMTTPYLNTNGQTPGVICYPNTATSPNSWLAIATDAGSGIACGTARDATTGNYRGSLVVPSSYVNTGWTVRIVLFWVP